MIWFLLATDETNITLDSKQRLSEEILSGIKAAKNNYFTDQQIQKIKNTKDKTIYNLVLLNDELLYDLQFYVFTYCHINKKKIDFIDNLINYQFNEEQKTAIIDLYKILLDFEDNKDKTPEENEKEFLDFTTKLKRAQSLDIKVRWTKDSFFTKKVNKLLNEDNTPDVVLKGLKIYSNYQQTCKPLISCLINICNAEEKPPWWGHQEIQDYINNQMPKLRPIDLFFHVYKDVCVDVIYDTKGNILGAKQYINAPQYYVVGSITIYDYIKAYWPFFLIIVVLIGVIIFLAIKVRAEPEKV